MKIYKDCPDTQDKEFITIPRRSKTEYKEVKPKIRRRYESQTVYKENGDGLTSLYERRATNFVIWKDRISRWPFRPMGAEKLLIE